MKESPENSYSLVTGPLTLRALIFKALSLDCRQRGLKTTESLLLKASRDAECKIYEVLYTNAQERRPDTVRFAYVVNHEKLDLSEEWADERGGLYYIHVGADPYAGPELPEGVVWDDQCREENREVEDMLRESIINITVSSPWLKEYMGLIGESHL